MFAPYLNSINYVETFFTGYDVYKGKDKIGTIVHLDITKKPSGVFKVKGTIDDNIIEIEPSDLKTPTIKDGFFNLFFRGNFLIYKPTKA